ncbi:MAG: serine O-acetyltransferase [Chloroflexota bacterium]|nr:serine O-acetyltransferase [Chloroflexota bacterium]
MPFSDEIRAIRERDPAARTTIEILLTYPGLHAIVLHRLASWLFRRRRRLLARFVSHLARGWTGIEIHPGATIGRGLFIDHGMGVVIGETTIIGDDVTLYQGVTLGGTGKQRGKRHPTVENQAVVGVGSSVLGAVTIGTGARVGAGAVVLRDVPPHTTAVGVPARAVVWRDPAGGDRPAGAPGRYERLPDPDRDTMTALIHRVDELEAMIWALTNQKPGASAQDGNARPRMTEARPASDWTAPEPGFDAERSEHVINRGL